MSQTGIRDYTNYYNHDRIKPRLQRLSQSNKG
ncbi:IS3 family transposase [Paraburkholderia sp. RL17-373-BIF-A]